jgi:hypothetical protein
MSGAKPTAMSACQFRDERGFRPSLVEGIQIFPVRLA